MERRSRAIKRSKKREKREVSEKRVKVGNGTRGFCRWCRVKLYNRVFTRIVDKQELKKIEREIIY